ncbi:MAG: ATP-binding protein [Agriterribacter sp.]
MLKSFEIKIAVIDDDENDYFIIADYIREIPEAEFIIDWYGGDHSTIDSIRKKTYDIYFVDYRLGSNTGLDLLKDVSLIDPDVPVVILTGKDNKNIALATMRSGATDYLVKSELNADKLERCIRYSLERAAYLRELKERETKYRNLFELSKDAVFIADEDMRLMESNQAAFQLFGYTANELDGRSFFDFMLDQRQADMIKSCIQQMKPVNDMEIQMLNRTGELRYCLFSMSFQQSRNKKMWVNGIVHNITELKNAEKANLLAQKLAANERLMRLLAHEIRNPLNNINLSVENFVMPDGDDSQQFLMDIIHRNSLRINQIITELLNLTKQDDLQLLNHDLGSILQESMEMTSDRISLQKVKVQKQIPETPCRLLADKAKLKIAFSNIIINAIEATRENAGELHVSLSENAQGHLVSITDNGVGIPEEMLSKLAEPFFTLKKNGMGLGLAASYSILQSHGARIQVKSKVNEGTQFMIQFQKS